MKKANLHDTNMVWEYKIVEIERDYPEENIEKQINDKKYTSWELVSIGSHLDLLGFQKIWSVFKRAKSANK